MLPTLMLPRTYAFLAAVALLFAFLLWFLFTRRRNPIFTATTLTQWNLWQLLVASFVTLFAELAIIRWIAVEVRIFAYFKNLALLLCFLGFGLGCALARKPMRWLASAGSLLLLLVMVRWPFGGGNILERLSQDLGATQDLLIWMAGEHWNWANFVTAAALSAVLLLLITYIFIPLGQTVSRQMDLAPSPLKAYSWNLAGSLAGILAFFFVCWASLPPAVWLSAIVLGIALLQPTRRERILVAGLILPVALLLHEPSTANRFSLWTPYQQIELQRELFPDGQLRRGIINVNHTGYQYMVDLSPGFLALHPQLTRERPEENPYNMPFRFSAAEPSVLIVGSGTGNDVAAALRHHARSVDAVDIDPVILAFGKREHPEHPYSSPRVTIHQNDARAFMKRTGQHYDLVLFGLLDSHTQFSDYANMRIDNFVYTTQALREARNLLNPDGVLFLKFQVDRPWLGRRLADMLTEVFGKRPLVFLAHSDYTSSATCYAISPSGRVDQRLAADPSLAQFAAEHRSDFLEQPPPPVTTDDWPYLYQHQKTIPRTHYSLAALVLLVAAALYWSIPEARSQAPSLFFFSMGAGFLLLETQVISRLALYFGTTWQVNGIVIAALLTALLLANAVIEKQSRPWPRCWIVAGLLAGLALAYFLPFGRLATSASTVGAFAAAIFAIPVFFAGLLFAQEFRRTPSPSAALGANMLGAVVGGLLENLSLVVGMRALLLVAAVIYAIAAFALPLRKTSADH